MKPVVAVLAIAFLQQPLPAQAQSKAEDEAVRCPATLLAPVAARQSGILAAARAGDYQALRREVTQPSRFAASFGEPGDPTQEWRRLVRDGVNIASIMAAIFAMPCSVMKVEGSTLYTWPSASDFLWSALTPQERAPLEKLYGAKIDSYWLEGRAKGYYVGWRGMIEGDGVWTVFVAGD